MIKLIGASIRNYKGIKSLDLAFSPEAGRSVYPIIGLNESGKTTILEALTFVQTTHQDLSALEIAGVKKQEPHQLIPIGERISFTGQISVSLKFALEDADIAAIKRDFEASTGYQVDHIPNKLVLKREFTFANAEKTAESSAYEAGFTYRKTKGKQAKPNSGVLWPRLRVEIQKRLPSLLYVPNFLFDLPGAIPLVPAASLEKPRDAFFHRLLDGLLKLSDANLSFEASLVSRAGRTTPQMAQAFNATVTKLEYALNQHVLQHWESIGGKKLQGLAMTLSTETLDDKPTLVMSLKQMGQQYRLEDRSLGFRWFFAFLMLTFYASAHEAARQTVFLLDEPASNLHAAAQSKLLSSLQRLVGSLFIYSTHSHYLLSPDLLPNTYVARNLGYDPSKDDEYVAQSTDIRAVPFRQFVSESPTQTEHFKVAMDVLDVPVSNLEFSLPCVFVEGKSDWYYLRLCQMTGQLRSTLFYPFGGVNTVDFRVGDALSRGSAFGILPDADTNISLKLNERYGEILRRATVDLGSIVGARKSMEDMFSPAIRKTIVAEAGLTGTSKQTFQRAAEICVASGKSIPLDSTTIDNFARLEMALAEVFSSAKQGA